MSITPATKAAARDEGALAFHQGKAPTDNPYTHDGAPDGAWACWDEGHDPDPATADCIQSKGRVVHRDGDIPDPVVCAPATPAPGSLEREIRVKCDEIADFLVGKNRAYGNSAADPIGVFAGRLDPLAQIDVRIDDKLNRLRKGSEYPGDDTVLDLTGYLILRMIVKETNDAA